MSQSYTILPFINPPAGAYDAINAIGSLNNNFTVSQTFGAGIVDSGDLSVAGASTFTGVCTFSAIPKFNAGIEVSIAEVDTGTLVVAGSSSLNGGLTVLGALSLPASSIIQSEVSNGYVDLSSAQTIAGVKTFSSPIVSSGASLSASSVPAASIVNKSIGDAQITLAGIGQTSVASGYVDLASAQSVAGAKSFSGALSGSSGLTISSGATSLQACSSTAFTASGTSSFQNIGAVNGTFSGPISGSAGLSITAGASTLQATTVQGVLTAGSIVDAGAFTATGLITGNAGLTISAGASSVQALTATTVSATTFTGALVGNATTCTTASAVNIVTDNTAGSYSVPFIKSNVASDALYVDDITTPTLTYNPSTGVLSSGGITSSGIIIGSGGLNLTGSIVYSNGIGSVVNATNDVAIALGGTSFGIYSTTPSANVNTLTITGASAGSTFDLLIAPSATITWRKAMSAGTVTIYNNLAGNQSMASGSRWWVKAKCVSATVVYLDFLNVT